MILYSGGQWLNRDNISQTSIVNTSLFNVIFGYEEISYEINLMFSSCLPHLGTSGFYCLWCYGLFADRQQSVRHSLSIGGSAELFINQCT